MEIHNVKFVMLNDLVQDELENNLVRNLLDGEFTYGDCNFSLVHRLDVAKCLKQEKHRYFIGDAMQLKAVKKVMDKLGSLEVDYIGL